MLQVGEHRARLEALEDLGEKRALAFVLEVVDREAGDDRVEGAEVRQRPAHVVAHELDSRVAREALPRCGEHRL